MTGFLSFASIFSSEFGSKTMRLPPRKTTVGRSRVGDNTVAREQWPGGYSCHRHDGTVQFERLTARYAAKGVWRPMRRGPARR
jgi:hypothetical protein